MRPLKQEPLKINKLIDCCQWELVHDLASELEITDLKQEIELPFGKIQSTPFQTLLWKAPIGLALFLLDLLEEFKESLCTDRDADGNTALHLFCANVDKFEKKELLVIEQLISAAPCSLKVTNIEGDTPLHLLVASKACIQSGDPSAGVGAQKAIALLVRESADEVLVQDSSGATPLHVAIAHHAVESVITALLEIAPSASKMIDKRTMLPLHYAAAFRYSPVAPIQAVVAANLSALTATTEDGDTPLHLLISNYPEKNENVDQSTLTLIEVLSGQSDKNSLETSAVIIQNKEKLTPIHCCAVFHAPPKMTRIIMRHPSANSASLFTNKVKATALHLAVAQDFVAISIENILAIGTADAAQTGDRLKRTPLHIAAENVHSTDKLISFLFQLCPKSASMATQRGNLPLHLAVQSHAKEEVINTLLRFDCLAAEVRNKTNNTPLHDAAKSNSSPEVVRLLLKAYKDAVYIENYKGNLPLHCATAQHSSAEVIQILLDAWPDAAAMQNHNQNAPLHYAAAYATSIETVVPLINAAPAAVLLLNSSGQSPIDRARANNAPIHIINLLESSAGEWRKKASQGGRGSFAHDIDGSEV